VFWTGSIVFWTGLLNTFSSLKGVRLSPSKSLKTDLTQVLRCVSIISGVSWTKNFCFWYPKVSHQRRGTSLRKLVEWRRWLHRLSTWQPSHGKGRKACLQQTGAKEGKGMNELIGEINRVLQIRRTLGVLGSALAICYLVFLNKSPLFLKLNNL
jgi:hypothetical protein